MFKILGGDQKEYGPVSVEVLKQWLAEGRVQPQTPVQAAGSTEWKPLSTVPELANLPGPVSPLARPAAVVAAPVVPVRTSRMAIASVVLGALGCLGITGLVGVILGLVALVKIGKSQGRLGGKGLAITGTCLSGFMLIFAVPFFALFAGISLPAFVRAKAKAQTINCVSNMKQISLGLRLYAADHNDALPPAESWCDAILQSIGGNSQVLRCPADNSSQRSSYAFNAKLSKMNVDKINPQTVMIFECNGGWNVSGGAKDMVTHHFHTYTVGMADGSVQQVSEGALGNLRWDP